MQQTSNLFIFSLLLITSLCVFTACNKDDDDNSETIIQLRTEILEEAEALRTPCDDADNTAQNRASLSAKIDELVALVPKRVESEKAAEILGAWLQVWSDNPFTEVDNICFDTDRIYQIVYADNFFYNISEVTAFGQKSSYFIRGQYEAGDDFLPVEFKDAYFSFDTLAIGTDLVQLGLDAEAGNVVRAPLPPTPVIGLTGQLGNIYVDEELRIITNGSSAAESSDIYVMRRQVTVE